MAARAIPQEVIDLIIEHLVDQSHITDAIRKVCHTTLRALRLVNSSCNDTASGPLFEKLSIPIWRFHELHNFAGTSQKIATHVKWIELRCDNDLSNRMSGLMALEEGTHMLHNCDMAGRVGYRAVDTACKIQVHSLHKIDTEESPLRQLFHQDLGFRLTVPVRLSVPSISSTQLFRSKLPQSMEVGEFLEYIRVCLLKESLLRIAKWHCRMDSLQVDSLPYWLGGFIRHSLPIMDMMRRLTNLTIGLKTPGHANEQSMATFHRYWAEILQNLVSVKQLELIRITRDGMVDSALDIMWSSCLESLFKLETSLACLPELESLKLNSWVVWAPSHSAAVDLVALIKVHGDSLKNLCLVDCRIVSSNETSDLIHDGWMAVAQNCSAHASKL